MVRSATVDRNQRTAKTLFHVVVRDCSFWARAANTRLWSRGWLVSETMSLAIGNVGKRKKAAAGGHAGGGHASVSCCNATHTQQKPGRATRGGSRGASSWRGGGGGGGPLECPRCGGDIRLIAFITEPGPIRKILTHLGEPLEPPPLSPARGPPTDWDELVPSHDDRAIFQGRIDELPAIDIHASDRCRTRGVESLEKGKPGRGLRTREKNATEAGAAGFEKPAPAARVAPPEAHESLIGRKTAAEAPLTGLSFGATRPGGTTHARPPLRKARLGHVGLMDFSQILTPM